MVPAIVFFHSNVAIGLMLGCADPGFFSPGDPPVGAGLALHILDLTLLTLQLPGLPPGQIALTDSLMDALLLPDLGLTNCRCTNLGRCRCPHSEAQEEDENEFGLHDVQFYTR